MRSAAILGVLAALFAPRAALAAEGAPAAVSPTAAPDAARATAAKAELVLKVVHPDDARKAIIARAEAAGGHVALATNERLTLKVPPASVTDLMAVAASRGIVLERSLTREDVTEPIAELEGRQRSKEEMLARLRPLLKDSSTAATLDVERTMTTIVEELEAAKGQLRVLRDRARFAVLDISFQFHRKERIERTHSPFEWLNSVDLDQFLGGFEKEARR
jgi:hypothetical protein